MFLTRMALNKARRGTARLLSSPQLMHAAVLSSFPPDAVLSSEVGRVLWRVDADGPHAWLYVLSPERPDLTAIVEQAGWPLTSTWETKPYEGLLERIHLGSEFQFTLVANPVRDVRVGPRQSKRLPHVTAAQQAEWLQSKALSAGFEMVSRERDGADDAGEPTPTQVEQLAVSDRRDVVFRRGSSKVTLRTARFTGILRVTDTELFRKTLGFGIGPAKGYGCGLLTVRQTVGAGG